MVNDAAASRFPVTPPDPGHAPPAPFLLRAVFRYPAPSLFVAWPVYRRLPERLGGLEAGEIPAALLGFALRSVVPARGTEASPPRTPTCRSLDASTPVIFLRGAVPLSSYPVLSGFSPRSHRPWWAPAADVRRGCWVLSPRAIRAGVSLRAPPADTALGFFPLSGLWNRLFGGAGAAHDRTGQQPPRPASGTHPLLGFRRSIPIHSTCARWFRPSGGNFCGLELSECGGRNEAVNRLSSRRRPLPYGLARGREFGVGQTRLFSPALQRFEGAAA